MSFSKATGACKPKRLRNIAALIDDGDSSSSDEAIVDSSAIAKTRASDSMSTDVFVQGVKVFVEQNQEIGHPKFYRRLTVNCPASCHCDVDRKKHCRRRRNIDISMGSQGYREALAFLGVWLRDGRSARSRDAHKEFRPGKQAIDNYMQEVHCNDDDIAKLMPSE